MGGKKLVTEADVRAMGARAELVVEPDTLLTPSARDLAFERGIRILTSAESGADCGCDESLWKRLLSEDGSYTVSVQAGRALVHRLTPSGPVEVGRQG